MRSVLSVTLEDLFLGKSIELEINKQIVCPSCSGSGAKSHDHIKQCSKCNGQGVVIQRQQFAPGMYQQFQTTYFISEYRCPACGGRGSTVTHKCSACKGEKVKRGSSQLTVEIEPGMEDGTEIIFEGESDESPDLAAGDLIFTLKQEPHKMFKRKGILKSNLGLNLYMTHSVSLKDALLGFKTTLKHLDGSDILIERESVTQNGSLCTHDRICFED